MRPRLLPRLLALVLLVASVGVAVYRVSFVLSSERASGEIVALVATATECKKSRGSGKSRYTRYYDCTRFHARVAYTTASGARLTASLAAGETQGHTSDTSHASRSVGQRVPLLYDPTKPSRVLEDSRVGVWGLPACLVAGSLLAFLVSLLPRRSSAW
jgi:hypothetical protein